MLRLAWRQIRHRVGRSLALGLAIVVAGTGFTVLTASSSASRLETTGTVQAHSRTLYDVLVRPPGSRSELERRQSLVQPGFLTGVYGGITMQQWKQIQHLSGVQVAAPVAVLGYVFPALKIPVDTSHAWARRGDSVARVDVEWSWDNGLTTVRQVPDFSFVTSRRLRFNQDSAVSSGNAAEAGEWVIAGTKRDICRAPIPEDWRPESRPSQIECFSRTSGGAATLWDYRIREFTGYLLPFALPYVVAAVDPASEDALVGLDAATTSGPGLVGATTRYRPSITGRGVPVVVADRVTTGETATVSVSRLPRVAATAVTDGRPAAALARFSGTRRSRYVITAQDAHEVLLRQLRTARPATYMRETRLLPGEVRTLGQVSLPQVHLDAASAAVEVTPPSTPTSSELFADVQYHVPGSGEPAARRIVTSEQERNDRFGGNPLPQTLFLRGTFDAAKLRGLGDVTAQVLGGYDAAPTEGADARSRRLLGGKPLGPSGHLGGFVQPPPMMLTTLDAAPLLTAGWTKGDYRAPISAIRVRVAGVTGVDKTSRERVRLVAQRIRNQTGLEVDITTGSSATRETLTLPAGDHGRPPLSLTQWWVKKGVAQAILKALDKKSLALFVLILLISALSVANAAISTVRSRRTELGVLACLGWQRSHLFRSVLAEITIIATVAGVVSAALSLGLGRLVGTPISLQRAIVAMPAALTVAVLAGLVPAWLAARSQPMDAVRPPVDAPAKARHPRSVRGLALVRVGRVKARSALAALGLAVAVLVFTVLLAITLAFQGAVVGTILGDAVAIQARAADYAATGASLGLAFLGVANVLYLNIRDRGAELATLRAVGWTDRHLDRLVITEGVVIGALGATPGAIAGVLIATAVTGTTSAGFVEGALIAWAAAMALAAAAAALATRLVRRLSTTLLLTE
ncbi:MAG TPA: ABC transporter permease [Marmoricola sp.]|nr:ABC transporter permease [Marmoricola sp.]